MKLSKRFPEKRVLITGAGSGLGRALAEHFARDGWRVGIADVNEAAMGGTARLVEQLGGEPLVRQCNVTVDEDMSALATGIKKHWGGVDIVINNAGVSGGGTVTSTSTEDWRWMLEINLLGVVRGCREFVPMLTKQGGGHIVNIASFAGIANIPAMASYNVAKAGVIALSETLRAELDGTGVGISVVCPSFFKTNLMTGFRSNIPGQQGWAERVMEKSPITAADVAAKIARAAEKEQFMVLTHKPTKAQYHLKRLAPERYFRELLKQVNKFQRR